MSSKELQRRVARLEADHVEREPDVTDEEMGVLSVLVHELGHERGAEISDEEWNELRRRGLVS
jgi:hypothetical protein